MRKVSTETAERMMSIIDTADLIRELQARGAIVTVDATARYSTLNVQRIGDQLPEFLEHACRSLLRTACDNLLDSKIATTYWRRTNDPDLYGERLWEAGVRLDVLNPPTEGYNDVLQNDV